MNKRRIGILGTGWIADMMARTVAGMKEVEAYAVASRSLGKAKQFAESHGFTKAYGSYGELVSDPLVELVYIATPHSEHYENAKMCLMAGKPVLCEKAFTAAAWQAQELMELSAQRGVFITEAIWTRYMPFSKTITDLVNSGIIGTPTMLSANLCYYNIERERMYLPELAGGALLDLGVYAINFATMVFGKDVVKTTSDCLMTTSKVDLANTITWTYADGRYAVLYSSNNCKSERHGIISGTKLAMNSVGSGSLQSGSVGAVQVQMAAIQTAHIEDAAVTRAKIGEAAVGSAQIEEAAIDTAHIKDAAVGTAKIENAAITSAKIGEGEIQTAHIEDAAITHAKIGDAAVGSANIENAAVGTAKIADAAITSAKIYDGAITNAKIDNAAITSAKIADGEISSAKIANAAITSAKIQDAAQRLPMPS